MDRRSLIGSLAAGLAALSAPVAVAAGRLRPGRIRPGAFALGCGQCGQEFDSAATGEYPCEACGSPTLHDGLLGERPEGFVHGYGCDKNPFSTPRRLARVSVAARLLASSRPGNWATVVSNDIPKDVEIVHISTSLLQPTFDLFLEHPDFAEVSPGDWIPWLNGPQFRREEPHPAEYVEALERVLRAEIAYDSAVLDGRREDYPGAEAIAAFTALRDGYPKSPVAADIRTAEALRPGYYSFPPTA